MYGWLCGRRCCRHRWNGGSAAGCCVFPTCAATQTQSTLETERLQCSGCTQFTMECQRHFFFPHQAQHSPGPRASHRKALSWATTPASNRKHTARHQHQRQTRKNGGIPPTRRGSRSLHDHTPNGHRPYDHNGESPRKAGQRPEQLYTGPEQKRAPALYKNAHCTQGGTGAPKGGLTRYTEARVFTRTVLNPAPPDQ